MPAPAPPIDDTAPIDQHVQWDVTPGFTDYETAVEEMEARAAAIRAGEAKERIWLVEHAPLYTAGTSADPTELLDPRFPVHNTGRGGRFTYHGPGQRVGYLMLDLAARGRDVRHFVHSLENWIIAALAQFDIAARAEPGRVGIWTGTGANEAKIGAIGIRVRRWVTLHGFAVNVAPDLSHFGGIVPCGLGEYPVTSMAALGKTASIEDFDTALHACFPAFLQSLDQETKTALEG
ncbi:lipoyl(octanoyl) transferase LipB [Stakelama sp. CBK3Z-3]|uniref:Octanoyltransferase n=1 Tax=Stakelama flava TaxID=2860338 RepID=A0ABS6XHY5_9SPHN|nr:lipoyl(octanoyl) transferase LipB [Stakelama flava]MBW4329822.1 lipoyl(octanoyl) transferase LipB [Stakelama flava]